jgi:Fic family protein
MNNFKLQALPPEVDLETKNILRASAQANRYLAELKGISKTIPNQGILIT